MGGSGSREMLRSKVEADELTEDEARDIGGVKVWPTPQTRDYRSERGTDEFAEKRRAHGRGLSLPFKVTWPTPSNSMVTVGDMEQARFAGNDPKRPNYQTANKMWRTPNSSLIEAKKGIKLTGRTSQDPQVGLADQVQGGQLNPDWVSWLMGWPIGADSLSSMPDLLWLDWEIDPADMEEADKYLTPDAQMAKHGTATEWEMKNRGTDYKLHCQVAQKSIGTGPIPRVATGIKDGVNRLKALGNGQVPQCMATAWNILTGDWFQ